MTNTRIEDAWREVEDWKDYDHVGDDLTNEQLDELWRVFAKGERLSYMGGWWDDKPHQIAYRLLLRLTRAENPK